MKEEPMTGIELAATDQMRPGVPLIEQPFDRKQLDRVQDAREQYNRKMLNRFLKTPGRAND